MDFGFDTIGNASVICYDRVPVLVTDPWVRGSAYFGSWSHAHEIPEEQMEAIEASRFVWFSHGHPDHLNADSLDLFQDKQILLPDHVGQRMRRELEEAGFSIRVLPDRSWIRLSERIRVLCISDESQNAVLLVDLGGRLLVNLNDSIDRGWGRFVRRIVGQFDDSILLALTGYGDADMINIFDEDGSFIEPAAGAKRPVGPMAAKKTESFGCKRFVPFSCMHSYQRADSVWANEYATPIADHHIGFESDRCEILPAYLRFFGDDGSTVPINPKATEPRIVDPIEFGDDWSEELDTDDRATATSYFRKIGHLPTFLDYVNLRVGGRDNVISFQSRGFERGITFEVPRHSLMEAIGFEVFDDLLIGNFMKTTLHGKWSESALYPDFTPFVTKYGDNGRAHSKEELREYFTAYAKRAPLEYLHHFLEERATNAVRSMVPHDSDLFVRLKRAYWTVKRFL